MTLLAPLEVVNPSSSSSSTTRPPAESAAPQTPESHSTSTFSSPIIDLSDPADLFYRPPIDTPSTSSPSSVTSRRVSEPSPQTYMHGHVGQSFPASTTSSPSRPPRRRPPPPLRLVPRKPVPSLVDVCSHVDPASLARSRPFGLSHLESYDSTSSSISSPPSSPVTDELEPPAQQLRSQVSLDALHPPTPISKVHDPISPPDTPISTSTSTSLSTRSSLMIETDRLNRLRTSSQRYTGTLYRPSVPVLPHELSRNYLQHPAPPYVRPTSASGHFAHNTVMEANLMSKVQSTSPPVVNDVEATTVASHKVDFVNTTLLSSYGVLPMGKGFTGGPQRSPKREAVWQTRRVRRLSGSNGSGSKKRPVLYGPGTGIENIPLSDRHRRLGMSSTMGGSEPHLPSTLCSPDDLNLGLVPITSHRLPSHRLSGIREAKLKTKEDSPSGISAFSTLAVENMVMTTRPRTSTGVHMERSGTFGKRPPAYLKKERQTIPERLRNLSSPRQTTFGATYQFTESTLGFGMTLAGNLEINPDVDLDLHLPTDRAEAAPPPLEVQERPLEGLPEKAVPKWMLEGKQADPPRQVPVQKKGKGLAWMGRMKTRLVTKSVPAMKPIDSTSKGATLARRGAEKFQKRFSTFHTSGAAGPSISSVETAQNAQPGKVFNLDSAAATTEKPAAISALLPLDLPPTTELDGFVQDVLDPVRRESIIQSLRLSSYTDSRPSSSNRISGVSDIAGSMSHVSRRDSANTDLVGSSRGSADTPALDPSSPTLQSEENEYPLETPIMDEPSHVHSLPSNFQSIHDKEVGDNGHQFGASAMILPQNPHLRRTSAGTESQKSRETAYYSAGEGDVDVEENRTREETTSLLSFEGLVLNSMQPELDSDVDFGAASDSDDNVVVGTAMTARYTKGHLRELSAEIRPTSP